MSATNDKIAYATKDDIVALSRQLDNLFTKLDNKIDAVENRLTARINELDNRLTSKIDRLENELSIRLRALEFKINPIWIMFIFTTSTIIGHYILKALGLI